MSRVYAFKILDSFLPIYPLYAVMFVERGLTPVQVSAALAAWAVAAFALQIPSGVISDRWSRRWILCGAQTARALGFLVWLLVPNFWGYFLGLALWGAKTAFTVGVFESLLYDELAAVGRREDYVRVNGRANAAGSAATLASALAAAWGVRFGYQAVLVFSLGATLAAGAAALALPRARRTLVGARADYFAHLAKGVRYAAGHAAIPWLIGLAAVSQAFGSGLEGLWPIYGAKSGLAHGQVAVFVAAVGGAQALCNGLAHRGRGAREGGFHLLLAGVGLLLALAAAVFRPWTVILIVLVAGLFKIIDVNFDARLHDAIPTEARATLASLKSFSGQAATSLLLVGFGPLAQASGYRGAFLICGLTIAALGLGFVLSARLRPRSA